MAIQIKNKIILSLWLILVFTSIGHSYAGVQDDLPLPSLNERVLQNDVEILSEMPVEFEKSELSQKNSAAQAIELSIPLTVLDDAAGKRMTLLKPDDENNLSRLWASMLRKDSVIQFAVRQINISPELRDRQKSVMAKTVSGLLSGVGLLPYVFGNPAAVVGGSIAAGNMAERILYKDGERVTLGQMPTDAELVSLSNVVDTQRKTLLENYFNYKQALDIYTNLQLQKQTIKRMFPADNDVQSWSDQFLAFSQMQEIERHLLKNRQFPAPFL